MCSADHQRTTWRASVETARELLLFVVDRQTAVLRGCCAQKVKVALSEKQARRGSFLVLLFRFPSLCNTNSLTRLLSCISRCQIVPACCIISIARSRIRASLALYKPWHELPGAMVTRSTVALSRDGIPIFNNEHSRRWTFYRRLCIRLSCFSCSSRYFFCLYLLSSAPRKHHSREHIPFLLHQNKPI